MKVEASMDLDFTWTVIVSSVVVAVGLLCGILSYFFHVTDFSFPVVCVSTGMAGLGIAKAMNTSYENARVA